MVSVKIVLIFLCTGFDFVLNVDGIPSGKNPNSFIVVKPMFPEPKVSMILPDQIVAQVLSAIVPDLSHLQCEKDTSIGMTGLKLAGAVPGPLGMVIPLGLSFLSIFYKANPSNVTPTVAPKIPELPGYDLVSNAVSYIAPYIINYYCGTNKTAQLTNLSKKVISAGLAIAPSYDLVSRLLTAILPALTKNPCKSQPDKVDEMSNPALAIEDPQHVLSKISSAITPDLIHHYCGAPSPKLTAPENTAQRIMPAKSIPSSHEDNKHAKGGLMSGKISAFDIDGELGMQNDTEGNVAPSYEYQPNRQTFGNESETSKNSQHTSTVQETTKFKSIEQNVASINGSKSADKQVEKRNGTKGITSSESNEPIDAEEDKTNNNQGKASDNDNETAKMTTSVLPKKNENTDIGTNLSNNTFDPLYGQELPAGSGGGGGGFLGGVFGAVSMVVTTVGTAIVTGVGAVKGTIGAVIGAAATSGGGGGDLSLSEGGNNPSGSEGNGSPITVDRTKPTKPPTKQPSKPTKERKEMDDPEEDDSIFYDKFKVEQHTNANISDILTEKYERLIRACNRTENKLSNQIRNLNRLYLELNNKTEDVNRARDTLGQTIDMEEDNVAHSQKIRALNAGNGLDNCLYTFSDDMYNVTSYLYSLLDAITRLKTVAFDMRQLMVEAVMRAVNFDHLIYKDIGKVRKVAKDAKKNLLDCFKPHFLAYHNWRKNIKQQWNAAINLGRTTYETLENQKRYNPTIWQNAIDNIILFTKTCNDLLSRSSEILKQKTTECVDNVHHQDIYAEFMKVLGNQLKQLEWGKESSP